MIEMVAIFAIIFIVVAYIGWSLGGSSSQLANSEKRGGQAVLLSDGYTYADLEHGNQFLAQLQSEIEVSLFPRPTDSVLKRHYDSLVAAKIGERLEQMPS